MAQRIDSRTIHTIRIDLQDDILARLEPTDEVEIVLASRDGQTSVKRLNYRDIDRLLNGRH